MYYKGKIKKEQLSRALGQLAGNEGRPMTFSKGYSNGICCWRISY